MPTWVEAAIFSHLMAGSDAETLARAICAHPKFIDTIQTAIQSAKLRESGAVDPLQQAHANILIAQIVRQRLQEAFGPSGE